MIRVFSAFLLATLVVFTVGEVFFEEEFKDGKWEERWVQSKHKDDYGTFKLAVGKDFDDEKRDQGIQTSKNASFYALSAKFAKKFSNRDKKIIIQYSVKHDQDIDCGGGYIKILPSTVDLEDYHDQSPYNIMFGPDKCGFEGRVHVIFTYKGLQLLIKETIPMPHDELTHLYTLILNPDKSYEVLIDGKKEREGKLVEDWDFLPPKKIEDPKASKPEDWDDREYIDDPNDSKPADWDKPEYIKDADAKKPEDWDDDMDGEWEPPLIENPEFKGEWLPRTIRNPDYKGPWLHPMIDNPDFKEDPEIGIYDDWGAIGFDLWQVKAGTIFDNIVITDDYSTAKTFAALTFDELMITERYKKKERLAKMKKENEELAKKNQEEFERETKDESGEEEIVDGDEGKEKKEKDETVDGGEGKEEKEKEEKETKDEL